MSECQTTYSAVLGVVLANFRKELNVEQADMAARMGLSQASYSRLESGKSAFSVDQLYQAASALGIAGDKLTSRLNRTIVNLQENDVSVVPQLRGNTTLAREGGADMGSLLTGAALGALVFALFSSK